MYTVQRNAYGKCITLNAKGITVNVNYLFSESEVRSPYGYVQGIKTKMHASLWHNQ